MATVPDQARSFLGTDGLNRNHLYINLCSGTHTVAATSVATHFTKAETSVSPTHATLYSGSWAGSNSNGTFTATQLTSGGTFTWTFSASVGTIYSYAVTTGTGLTGTLVGAEMLSPAQVVSASGDKISVVVKLATT